MLDHRAAHADDVDFLKGVGSDLGGVHLPGDDDQRDGIGVGVGDGGQQVGCAGAAGGHANADPSGGAGVSSGGERSALFMAGQHHPDRRIDQRLVEFDRGGARIGEKQFDAEGFQRPDGDFSAFAQVGGGMVIFHIQSLFP
ncbi:hypothetical protein SDC9_157474 [bioreactor metagenome]|uniref:Uncharacterized protein n=1 Tax=bioreactor metagenome TaxID=1076179 RepID=A0A645FA35_9ZZZZ